MENEFAYNARYPLHPFINRCRTAYVRDRRSTAVLWRSHGRLLICFARGFDARALSRIAADATIRICPNARRERSPARPWRTCAPTLRLRQNAGPRRSPARSLKNWRVKRRLKPLPNFASDRPWPPGTRVQRPHSRHRPAREHAHQGRASVLAPTQSRHPLRSA